MIYGNREGIRNSILDKLEEIYDIRVGKEEVCNNELIDIICDVTISTEREVSVAIDRKGSVLSVALGDSSSVELPVVDTKTKKLSGVRIIHTHPNGNSTLSALDTSALLKLKLDCIAAIGVDENGTTDMTLGFCDVKDDMLIFKTTKKYKIEDALKINILSEIKYLEENIKVSDIQDNNKERAILVGIENEESLDELAELARACNVSVVDKVLQKRSKIDSALYVGKGKVEELAMLRQAESANVIIFDDELSASQIRNLENLIGTKVIDRTTLILEIFATRAKSKEANIQVELAQLKYRLPRLSGLGTMLSRTGGGIGTKGPGEKKLEIDKRHIRERIYDLSKELEKIKKVRETQRASRSSIPKVSLVGYTNAGKSTLRNLIYKLYPIKDNNQKEDVMEANMLFATLDITTRAVLLPNNETITLTDTVGFIRKLPHDLVEAFKSTLEEVVYSDLLLHVVDISSDQYEKHIEAVNLVLEELNSLNKPTILLLNKMDNLSEEELNKRLEKLEGLNYLPISAKNNLNIEELIQKVCEALPNKLRKIEYLIPYSEQSMVSYLHRNSKVLEERYEEEGTYISAQVDDLVFNTCRKYEIK